MNPTQSFELLSPYIVAYEQINMESASLLQKQDRDEQILIALTSRIDQLHKAISPLVEHYQSKESDDREARQAFFQKAATIFAATTSHLDKMSEVGTQGQRCQEIAAKIRLLEVKFSDLIKNSPLQIVASQKLVVVDDYQPPHTLPSNMVKVMQILRRRMGDALAEDHAVHLIQSFSQTCAGYADACSLYVESHESISNLLKTISARLQQETTAEALKKKRILTEIVVLSCIHPILDNSRLIVLSPQRLLYILERIEQNFLFEELLSIVPFGDTLNVPSAIYQKLLRLSRLNFNAEQMQKFESDSLACKIFNSPHLRNFLFHAIHVPQIARQTCVGASHNHLFQSRCATIAELMSVAESAVALACLNFNQCPQAVLDNPAYEVQIGTAPSVRSYIEMTIKEVQDKLEKIRQGANTLATQPSVNLDAVRRLTTACNFAMQQLEAVLNPKKLVILSTQVLPQFYKVSAVLSSVATTATAWMPGQPTTAARFEHAIDHEPIKILHGRLFQLPRLQSLGEEEVQIDIGAALKANKISILEIRKQLLYYGGAIIVERGHAYACFAITVEGEPHFLVRDSMRGEKLLSADNLAKQLMSQLYVFILVQPHS
ncbi:MAG: hypothetical protein LLG04_09660 [Parachlamydia sp.]|nr:hypothetical protein [Parachlamydia sp.]